MARSCSNCQQEVLQDPSDPRLRYLVANKVLAGREGSGDGGSPASDNQGERVADYGCREDTYLLLFATSSPSPHSPVGRSPEIRPAASILS